MDFQQIIDSMTPDIYQNFRRAVEIGKWADGRVLTSEQRELCLQAIIAYDARKLPEQERVGYIDRGSKADGEVCGDSDDGTGNKLKWVN